MLCFSYMSALEPRCWKAEALNAAAESLDSASWSTRSPAEVSWLAAQAWWRADWIRWCSALLTSYQLASSAAEATEESTTRWVRAVSEAASAAPPL